jgi:hypothetical protein
LNNNLREPEEQDKMDEDQLPPFIAGDSDPFLHVIDGCGDGNGFRLADIVSHAARRVSLPAIAGRSMG